MGARQCAQEGTVRIEAISSSAFRHRLLHIGGDFVHFGQPAYASLSVDSLRSGLPGGG
jgi:serine phosphatase RsbU (regulator of sigma subunit)